MPDSKRQFPRTLRTFNKKNPDHTEVTPEPFTFLEARRRKDNAHHIYEVLIKELYEEGCKRTAHHFRCLVEQENKLSEHGSIRDHLKDDIKLLMELYEKSKSAETVIASKACGSLSTAFRLFYEIIILLEINHTKYEWLLEKVFKIIVHIVEREAARGVVPTEMPTRIYLKYGIYLAETDELQTSMHYLSNAMELSKGQKWIEDNTMFIRKSSLRGDKTQRPLSEVASYYLAKESLKYAKGVARTNSLQAAELAERALKMIAQVGIDANKEIFIAACIACANYLMEAKQFEKALKMLTRCEFFVPNLEEYTNESIIMMRCELLIVRGSCHSSLNQNREAKEALQKAIKLAKSHNFKFHEAESQLSLGKFYAKNGSIFMAKNSLQSAKRLFGQLNDKRSSKKTLYLLAKLHADEVFPYFLDLMKSDSKCSHYKLRQWKNMCEPFWRDMAEHTEKDQIDEIYCLLVREKHSARRSTAKEFFTPTRANESIVEYRGSNSKFLVL